LESPYVRDCPLNNITILILPIYDNNTYSQVLIEYQLLNQPVRRRSHHMPHYKKEPIPIRQIRHLKKGDVIPFQSRIHILHALIWGIDNTYTKYYNADISHLAKYN
jgi:hypothetical protein